MNQKRESRLISVIYKYAVLNGCKTQKAQAERALIDRNCYARRLHNPGLFTLDELEKVQRAFRIPWEEISEALA